MNKSMKIKRIRRIERAQKLLRLLCAAMCFLIVCTVPAMAAAPLSNPNVQSVFSSFDTLIDIVYQFIHVVGVFVFGYGWLTFGKSWANHEPSSKIQGLEIVAGGAIIFLLPTVIDMFA